MVITATTTTFLTYALSVANYWKYPLIFVGTIVEGPMIMVASGFMLSFHIFDLIPLFIVLAIGDLVGDVIWYFIGNYFAGPIFQSHGKFWGIKPELYEKAKNLFAAKGNEILLISKMTMGLGLSSIILILAGATKIPFKKYLAINLLGELFFASVLLTIGFYFAQIYDIYIVDAFKIGFIIVISVVVIILFYVFSRIVKNKVLDKI